MPPIPTSIYRIFDAENLRSILNDECFFCPRILDANGKQVVRISHSGIMDRRQFTNVPCGPRGCLDDYVAFYFAPRSPMLYSIYKGYVDGHDGNQERVIYAVSTAQAVAEAGKSFVFTDGHGIMALTDFFDNLADLHQVDWTIMDSKFWNDTDKCPDRKRCRQAEFLVHEIFPWSLVHEIAVMTDSMAFAVQNVLTSAGVNTPISVRPEWYYC